jgi:hypothetical protein
MKRLARSALALLAITLAPTSALAASVKGKVTNTRDLLNSVWNEAKDPAKRRFTFREPAASVPADARVLRGHLAKELCVAATSEAGGAKPAGAMRIVVEGGRTSVVTVVVAPGQELQFENHDPTPHTLYEVNGKGDFSKATLAPNAQRKWTPTAPGVYELRDELSPSLRSWIVVEPKLVKAAFPTRRGDLSIDLEPGAYKLQAYFQGAPVGEAMPIDVRPVPAEQPLPGPLKAGPDKSATDKPAGAPGATPASATPASATPAPAAPTPAAGG